MTAHDRADSIRDAVAAYRYALANDRRSLAALMYGTPCAPCFVEEVLRIGLLLGAERPLTDDGRLCDEDKEQLDQFLAALQRGFTLADAGLSDDDGCDTE